ncbi:hypothetical protein FKW77_006850 [Venturia effusa]|uniref:CFEM domain-containing protein n=1 Tax=Venturia effusa TaxID=50376 RepID=A0A517LHH0_9PEZI|nr:hypothetical protein FKW77_006850 [Venturia effusa]
MKIILALLALGATSVTAQAAQACAAEIAAVPQCGATCIEKSATAPAVGCPAKDHKCFCSKRTSYEAEAVKCGTSSCSPAEIIKTKTAADAVCACVNKSS